MTEHNSPRKRAAEMMAWVDNAGFCVQCDGVASEDKDCSRCPGCNRCLPCIRASGHARGCTRY